MDIVLWVKCYSFLIAVVAKKHPKHIAHYTAYQRSIIKASQNFDKEAWIVYDRCSCCMQHVTRSLAKIDSALYNKAFMGQARLIPSCHFCLSKTHGKAECPSRFSTYPTHGYKIPSRAYTGTTSQAELGRGHQTLLALHCVGVGCLSYIRGGQSRTRSFNYSTGFLAGLILAKIKARLQHLQPPTPRSCVSQPRLATDPI